MNTHNRKMTCKLVTLVILVFAFPQLVFGTALDDYVKKPDASYEYSVVDTIKGKGYTACVIDMTSQSWRSKKEVDRTLWKHWLTIIKPDKIKSDIGLLWINGGSNNDSAPTRPDGMLVNIAVVSGTVVTDLRMVPNQPLNFPDGGRPRYEDAIIAYTFDKCLATGDETWPLLLPMVKSAVRAMDTVQKHIASVSGGAAVEQFVVAGASKRGWTTWLTAAVDKRVIAISPVVIDVLNMDESMKHHFSAYGFYSPVIQDYVEMKIMQRIGTPKAQQMLKVVDPYEYRSRFRIPKYLINAAGDQFFLPDSSQFYFDDLPGEKYLRYVPNTDHGLGNSDAIQGFMAFYGSVLTNSPRPKFAWQVKEDKIIVRPISGRLKKVNLWQASNEKTRDFRLEIIGPAWKSSPLKVSENGVRFDVRVDEPEEGWTAFFVEMVYDSGSPIPYKFTTQVHVVPQRLPFADKYSGYKVSPDKIGISLSYRPPSRVGFVEIVLRRIEKALASVDGIKSITSRATDEAGETIIEVKESADVTKVLKDVKAVLEKKIYSFSKRGEKPAWTYSVSIIRDDEKKSGAKGEAKKKGKAQKVLYAELTPQEFRERIADAPIAYLPLGTLEWHGEHLPIGSDGLQSYGFFIELAREVGGIVLPMLFLGPDRMQKVDGKELYGMDICKGMPEDRRYPDQQLAGSAYWVPEETFRAIIEATLKQLSRAGFKIVVGHGHGPSTGFFQKHAKEWKEKYGLDTFTCWGSDYDRQGLGIQVDHAAMNETSLVMAFRPELVQMDRLPKIDEGWPVGVGGKDPRIHASAKLGRKAIKLQIKRMTNIMREAMKNLELSTVRK